MARVESVVPETVHKNGYAILNADNDLVFGMQKNLGCKISLYIMDKENQRIKDHCERGDICAVLETDRLPF